VEAYLLELLVLAAALATAALLERFVPLFRSASAAGSGGHLARLEGLRGVLALAVVVHHVHPMQSYVHTGHWGHTGTPVANTLGGLAVTAFFYLSGFLFWRKALRGAPTPAKEFFLARARRIAPAYLALVAAVVAYVAITTNFVLRVPVWDLVRGIGSWLAFGLAPGGLLDLGGVDRSFLLVAGVIWTLRYEWLFYFCFPLLARYKANIAILGLVAVGLIALDVAFLQTDRDFMSQAVAGEDSIRRALKRSVQTIILGFGGGMAVAACLHRWPKVPRWTQGAAGGALVVLCAVAAIGLRAAHVQGTSPLVFPAFFLIAAGNSVFGLLERPWLRVAGTVSYSVYLFHGLFLHASLTLLRDVPVPLAMGIVGAGVMAFAAVTYRLFEHPFLAAGAVSGTTPRRAP